MEKRRVALGCIVMALAVFASPLAALASETELSILVELEAASRVAGLQFSFPKGTKSVSSGQAFAGTVSDPRKLAEHGIKGARLGAPIIVTMLPNGWRVHVFDGTPSSAKGQTGSLRMDETLIKEWKTAWRARGLQLSLPKGLKSVSSGQAFAGKVSDPKKLALLVKLNSKLGAPVVVTKLRDGTWRIHVFSRDVTKTLTYKSKQWQLLGHMGPAAVRAASAALALRPQGKLAGLAKGASFTAIIGPNGSGKTTLLFDRGYKTGDKVKCTNLDGDRLKIERLAPGKPLSIILVLDLLP